MKRHAKFLLSVGVVIYSVQGSAYEVATHELVSEAAAKGSTLVAEDLNLLGHLGLPPSIEDNTSPLTNSQGTPRNVLNLIRDGARFEDTLVQIPPRPLHHFYDPIRDRGLVYPGCFSTVPLQRSR